MALSPTAQLLRKALLSSASPFLHDAAQIDVGPFGTSKVDMLKKLKVADSVCSAAANAQPYLYEI